jgi:YVTN family beta-propeller protein
MHTTSHRIVRSAALLAAGALIGLAAPLAAAPDESPFLAENKLAMDRMMTGMEVRPSGDIDRDFAAMMIPHHQGAIDMATAELRHGRNELLRRIAQEIIVDQQQEIAAMHLALGEAAPAGAPAPTQGARPAPPPSTPARPSLAVSHRDRVYAAEQFSNTVSVTDPVDGKLLGVIRLGDPTPGNLSPLYRGQLLVHGLGFSPDHHTLVVVSIGTNAVTFIDTATNAVKHVTYLGRAPHEAFFTPDGREVWVSVRGEDYVAVLDAADFTEKTRIKVPAGPGMTIFSPDGRYGYVCSSFNPETDVISVADHKVVGTVTQASPFCPNLAVSPDGKQVWLTLKDVGKVQVFDARPPFATLKTIDIGPITNHVNLVANRNGSFAYVTVGGRNEVQVFRTGDFARIATIPVGKLPHGLWPSGDGTRIVVGLENDDQLAVIDTLRNRVVTTVGIGQGPQAVVYVPDAVPVGDGTQGLQPLGVAGQSVHLTLAAVPAAPTPGKAGQAADRPPTSVTLFDQGILQVLQASVTGLVAKQPYVLALCSQPDGSGRLEPLAAFTANPAGAAIVNAVGPIRQIVQPGDPAARRYLVIASGTAAQPGPPVQVQAP